MAGHVTLLGEASHQCRHFVSELACCIDMSDTGRNIQLCTHTCIAFCFIGPIRWQHCGHVTSQVVPTHQRGCALLGVITNHKNEYLLYIITQDVFAHRLATN